MKPPAVLFAPALILSIKYEDVKSGRVPRFRWAGAAHYKRRELTTLPITKTARVNNATIAA
jgi:hypothetical protein